MTASASVRERILTRRELNRALLARQLLLERARSPLTRVLERVAGLQTQYAPSGYLGLWSRLDGFALDHLTRALERRRAVQATLMRATIHVVSAGDFPLFAAGTRRARQEAWVRSHRRRGGDVDMDAAAERLRTHLAGGVARGSELVELLSDHGTGATMVFNGLGAWLDLVRVPPSGTWDRRRADLYATAADWLGSSRSTSEEEGLAHLLRRYLGGFGPAPLADAANWAGVPAANLRLAAERLRLRTFRDEDGAVLLDLPRGLLPDGRARAPVRFLPTWDATLLVHVRRTQVLPEPFRARVFNTRTPHSLATFLVDGAVAGAWRIERSARKATLTLEPFEPLPAPARRAVREEAERLVRFHEPDALSYSVA
ncbi:MAG: winged helix DNA-binding domain-containing protein [Actinomycetota bacterium]|nr:winged helix DNA-binding domain-containing protein [Actinomycetota bacterium]